jgi:NADH-quinone oxidoreductase subunit A
MNTDLAQYLPVVILAAVGAVFAVASVVVSRAFQPKRPTTAKMLPYECGIVPEQTTRQRFPVKFYVIAMLFIVFDIEVIFLFPWAVTFRQLGLFGLTEMAIFIGLVFVAYVYVWKKGGLEWTE